MAKRIADAMLEEREIVKMIQEQKSQLSSSKLHCFNLFKVDENTDLSVHLFMDSRVKHHL